MSTISAYTKVSYCRCDNISPRSFRPLIVFVCVHKSVNEARECTEFAVKSLNTDVEKKVETKQSQDAI